jgi:predicted lysophospholipase L1 biosynthesis ABC-type transport system permease subunit
VARHSFAPIVAGLVVGVIAALASGRFVASLLYGIDPRDPAVLAVAASLLLAAGLIASTGPLRRALRVDPATVLRET